MKEKEMLKKELKEIWEREMGIKSAFYNACEMFLCIKKRNEGEGYNEYEENPHLAMLWGGIVGVLSCSAINEYIDLDLDVKDEGIEVYVFVDGEKVVIDDFNVGDYWVDYYKNGTTQYWEMANF